MPASWSESVRVDRPVTAVLSAYLEYLEGQGLATHTVTSSRLDLVQLARFVGRQPLREITLADLRTFFQWLERQQGNSVSSLRRKTSTVKRFFRQLHADSLLDEDPSAGLIYPALEAIPSEPLTLDEADAIVAAATNLNWRVLALCLLDAGLKRDEVVAVRWEDIELDAASTDAPHGLIHVRHRRASKQVRQRTLSLTARLRAALVALQAEPPQENGSILGISARGIDFVIETCAKRAGVRADQKITPQMLRDGYACGRVGLFQDREESLKDDPAARATARREHDGLLARELGLSSSSAVPDRYRAMVDRLKTDRAKQVRLDDCELASTHHL
jgi:site-specific recombinase XerD